MERDDIDPPEIEVVGLSATRGGRRVLHDVSFTLDPGVCLLLGRNGAGKSTLIRSMCGLGAVDAGVVLRSGVDVRSSRASMRLHQSTLGWLPQHPGAHAGMRVDRFLAYAAWLKRLPRREASRQVHGVTDRCDIGSISGRRVGQLSGGERQRVMLAVSLLGEPKLLILDEPSAGLDPAQREQVLSVVAELGSATVVIATHDVADASVHADHVIVLGRGKVSRELRRQELDELGTALGRELTRLVTQTAEGD